MNTVDIPLDKAELLSVLLEAILYGFSLLMCGGTIWILFCQRSPQQVSRRMLTVACSLLLFSTVHLVIDFIRVVQGFILYRNAYPGGPVAFFSDVSQWTFVYKNYVYTAQTLIGDGVLLYRCYAVWQSKLVMILPATLWCAVALAGIGGPYTASRVTQAEVFGGGLSWWITSFYASTLTCNLLTTILLASRIWYVDRRTTRICGRRESRVRPILHIVIDAGVIYSLTLLAALICFVNKSNGQYVILDTVTPIISITFYMIIIRVRLAARTECMINIPLRNTRADNSLTGLEERRRTQVHITTLTERKFDYDQPASSVLAIPTNNWSGPGEGNPYSGTVEA